MSLRAPVPGVTYFLAEDPAGGQATANADSYGWAIAHVELDASGRLRHCELLAKRQSGEIFGGHRADAIRHP